MRSTVLSSVQAIQSAVSAKTRLRHPTGRRNSPTTAFCSGSILVSVDLASVSNQMLSVLAAIALAICRGPDVAGRGHFEGLRIQPEQGFISAGRPQRLVNAETMPEQGCFKPAMGSPGLLVLALILTSDSGVGT